MEALPREVREYCTRDGKVPFREWFDSLRDLKAKAKIQSRIDRAEDGNLGEWNHVGEGVFEMKIDFGPGYRIYFGEEGKTMIILLCGGDKSSQEKDIKRAREYWADYKGR